MFNILVVEDDFNTRRLMCAVLERYGFKLEDVEHFNTEKVENCEFFMNGTGWESLFKK